MDRLLLLVHCAPVPVEAVSYRYIGGTSDFLHSPARGQLPLSKLCVMHVETDLRPWRVSTCFHFHHSPLCPFIHHRTRKEPYRHTLSS
jgi:hypothetical protein